MSSVADAKAAKTMLKAQVLPREQILYEFVEKPGCNSLYGSGTVRRVELTTHRVSYLETYRKNWYSSTPPSMRQVFVTDVCELAIDNYRKVGDSLLKKVVMFLLKVVCPIGGIVLIIGGREYYEYSSGYRESVGRLSTLQIIGIALIVVGIIAILFSLCRKKAPQIIIETRCPQFPAFVITLGSSEDRLKLVDALSTVIAKQQ